jgi:hypothetical protein
MSKHLIVFLAFSETDIIKTSFDSVCHENFDYFIIENKSENSDKISEYFKEKKYKFDNIKGYIQFEENISATAIDCFLIDFDSFIKNYEYITITDGDFYIYDINDVITENVLAFNNKNCMVSSTPLYMKNNYGDNPNRVIGTDVYIEKQKERLNISHSHTKGITSNCFLTFKTNNIDFLKTIHYIDTTIHSTVNKLGGDWLVSSKNQAYHLTWDLYIDGNPYYEWKKEVIGNIWQKKPVVNYNKIF